ncbi:MAG TPA: CAP domain-containing protein [Thermoanaerobaculia bacterium]
MFKWREERETRETVLRFRQDRRGDWHVHNAVTIQHSLRGSILRLVDCNVNGDFNEPGMDGYCVGDSDTVMPLQERLLLEDRVVEIDSLSADGVRLSARVAPVEGSPQQLEALARINRLRSANGLPAVELDLQLSRACTAHAEYLELHDWSGLTNPHDQTLGTEGASEEGREAARRSTITRARPADSIADFWNTYYHRIPLMSPVLARIGVNERPAHLAVVDVGGAFEQSPKQPWPWSLPISVPSPGAVGFPTNARSELPDEPVPDLASRGCPLILVFPRGHPPLTSFSGTLRRLERGEAHELPVLVADQGLYTFAYGLVPEQPLKAGSDHEAIFSFTLGGESRELVVPFRTE